MNLIATSYNVIHRFLTVTCTTHYIDQSLTYCTEKASSIYQSYRAHTLTQDARNYFNNSSSGIYKVFTYATTYSIISAFIGVSTVFTHTICSSFPTGSLLNRASVILAPHCVGSTFFRRIGYVTWNVFKAIPMTEFRFIKDNWKWITLSLAITRAVKSYIPQNQENPANRARNTG